MPAVARLFKTVFRPDNAVSLPDLARYLQRLFLDGPEYDPACPSLVHVSPGGTITGFIGSLAQPMSLDGRPVRAAHACGLMVENPRRDSLAGARLLRSFVSGAQDLSYSETSGPQVRAMWSRVGGRAFPGYSMLWIRLLRPAAAVAAFLAGRSPAFRLLHPLGALADRAVSRLPGGKWWNLPAAGGATTVTLDPDAAVDIIEALMARHALRPQWSPGQLAGRLAHARHIEAYGDLVCAKVLDSRGALIGCHLYHLHRSGIGSVLHVMAREDAAEAVLASLLRDAYARGAVSLCGRVEPALLDGLLQTKCILLNRDTLTAQAHDPALLAAIGRGDAVVTGLAGESWTRLTGGFLTASDRGD